MFFSWGEPSYFSHFLLKCSCFSPSYPLLHDELTVIFMVKMHSFTLMRIRKTKPSEKKKRKKKVSFFLVEKKEKKGRYLLLFVQGANNSEADCLGDV